MTEETKATQASGAAKMPNTWQEAVELWDAGKALFAFQVESEGATQEELWGLAFTALKDSAAKIEGVTDREVDVVKSIIHVAKLKLWPQMVSEHVHQKSPALTIQKPK